MAGLRLRPESVVALLPAVVLLSAGMAVAGESRCSGQGDAYAQVACELADAATVPLCDGVADKIQRRVARKLGAASRLVERAGPKPAKRQGRLVGKADKRLSAAGRQVERAGAKGKLPDGCAGVAGSRLAGLRALVAELGSNVPTAPAGLPD